MQYERIAPFLGTGVKVAAAGAVVGAFVILLQQRLAEGTASWGPTATIGMLVGMGAGFGIGVIARFVLRAIDNASPENQRRILAEKHDVHTVITLYRDIEAGTEMHAWHALGLLPTYKDERVTHRMFQCLRYRLENRKLHTSDPSELVRQAILTVMAVNHPPDIAYMKDICRHENGLIGSWARRIVEQQLDWQPAKPEDSESSNGARTQ